jgi:hypothetical protein
MFANLDTREGRCVDRTLRLRVYENQALLATTDTTGDVELGRQRAGEAGPFALDAEGERSRLVIAPKEEQSVSRLHALVQPLPDGRVRVTNISDKLPLHCPEGDPLPPRGVREVALPVVLVLGNRTVRVQEDIEEGSILRCLTEATAPPTVVAAVPRFECLVGAADLLLDSKAVVRWLQATLAVFQSAACCSDFFNRAAQALVDMVDLDSGRVLLLEGGDWAQKAVRSAAGLDPEACPPPSRHVLGRVQREKRTFWELPPPSEGVAQSLRGLGACVAAPILDRSGEVIGALYGDRFRENVGSESKPLTELEAMLVKLLASSSSPM